MATDEPAFKPRRRNQDTEMDITPMIDIVFLLLAFFVVSSKMKQPAPMDLPTAKHGREVVIEESVVISVMKDGDEIKVSGGGKKNRKDFTSTGDKLTEEIEAYVSEEIEANPDKIKAVLIKCEFDVTNGQVDPIFVAAKKSASEASGEIDIKTAIKEKD